MVHCKSHRSQSQVWFASVALCFTLGSLAASTSSALAIKYNPKKPTSPKGPSISGGPRGGCNGDQTSGLTALAPIAHIGRTTSDRPTVAWFIPDSKSYPVILRLSQYGGDQKWRAVSELTMNSQAGVMKAVFPEDLEMGVVYAWQVIVDCKPGYNSARLVDEGQIQRVDPLKNLLQNPADSSTKAEIYGDEGIWYDALSEILAVENSPSQGTLSALLNRLIDTEQPYFNSIIETSESKGLDCKSFRLNAENKELCKKKAAIEKRLKNLSHLVNQPQ